MKTIYKFPLNMNEKFNKLEMPNGAEILTMQLQYGIPCIWAVVDTKQPKVRRTFMQVGTGEEMHPNVEHSFIGTYQIQTLVFHLFEIPTSPNT